MGSILSMLAVLTLNILSVTSINPYVKGKCGISKKITINHDGKNKTIWKTFLSIKNIHLEPGQQLVFVLICAIELILRLIIVSLTFLWVFELLYGNAVVQRLYLFTCENRIFQEKI